MVRGKRAQRPWGEARGALDLVTVRKAEAVEGGTGVGSLVDSCIAL